MHIVPIYVRSRPRPRGVDAAGAGALEETCARVRIIGPPHSAVKSAQETLNPTTRNLRDVPTNRSLRRFVVQLNQLRLNSNTVPLGGQKVKRDSTHIILSAIGFSSAPVWALRHALWKWGL